MSTSKNVKGVILAGGQGTRLRPFTHVINKHFLPIYDKPLIYYSLLAMRDAGVTEVFMTCNKEDLPSFQKLLGDGSTFGLTITYGTQDAPKGIADALGIAEEFADGAKIAVILGDNVYTNHDQIKNSIEAFKQDKGARLFLKEVSDPERFGVAVVQDGKIISVVEKPKNPTSNLAVTGLYLYDPDVFQIIKTIVPSARGELEITDVNAHYVKQGLAKYEIIDGDWIDAGTFDSFVQASVLMLQRAKGFPVDLT